jgi:hypothetical protein
MPTNVVQQEPATVSEILSNDRESSSALRRARWYLSRFASMEPAEIVWRARTAVALPLEWALAKRKPAVRSAHWAAFHRALYPVQLNQSGIRMEKIRVFDLEFPLGFEFDWHRDYRYGKRVEPRFAGAMNIRDTAVVSDIKYIWEPSRHQHLSALAFAANADSQADYIVRSLDSWLRTNPYLYGVNWTSSLELAERLVSWALLYPRIADYVARDGEFRQRWLNSIYQHMARISRNLSLYSSANNHLMGELVSLFVGASCFDFWPECEGWRSRAQILLEREIRRQVGEDGVNCEQALSYHLFVMELLVLAFIVGRNAKRPFSQGYADRLRGMAAFLDTIATASGDLPWYGDSDDARGFVLSEGESGLEVVMQLAGLLFAEPQWLRFRPMPTAPALALVPDLVANLDRVAAPTAAKPRELFPDAGLACLRSNDGSVRLMMDFGPLGFTSIAAHGHADALSLWLAIGDEYFLVDAGTYAYHSHPEWRSYFRSTAAHNTACVDGKNQSEMAGPFLWREKAKSRLLRFDRDCEQVTVEAEHDGYARLQDPVIHRRAVQFDCASGDLNLEDSFQCAGRHEVELFFHLHEDAEVLSVSDGEAQVHWRGRRIVFSSPDCNARWEVLRGSDRPKLGWRSRRFNQKEPIATLRIRAEINGSSTILTQVRINP